ncbi:MAG: MBL fold metallo-hydrolase [Chloroflexi bacterium]|jgi:ribonuclease BN (tRNA processing enzyme)|nr:MBL fold metallo-hydrolase [Chloroflexota bacterium]
MRIKFLGTHNAESRSTRLVSFVIDEQLAIEAGSLTSELTFAEQTKIKWILISHGHYDHITTIPTLAFNNIKHLTRIYSTPGTLEVISGLIDGVVYPEFTSEDSYLGKATIELIPIEPYVTQLINGYEITAIPVNHPLHAVGFEIVSAEGSRLFYSGDTGCGLNKVWERVSPQILIIDVTFPNRFRNIAEDADHLCPEMLMEELISFKRIKGYFPKVITIHMSPQLEEEIAEEVAEVASKLEISITVSHEGQEINPWNNDPSKYNASIE